MITDAQRMARRNGIGGSDMPIILGLSNYKTPYQLYLEKIGEADDGFEETPLQYWGTQIEDVIRNEFAKRNDVVVEQPDSLVHPFHDFLIGNLDGFVPSMNAVLEVKCSNQFMASEWGDLGSDTIPMQYLVQVAHYCAITNADCAYIAVLIGGWDYREYKYIRDLELEETLIAAAKAFWKCVRDRTPPAPVKEIDLRLMFPKHDPSKIKTVPQPIAEQLTALADTRFKIKDLSALEDKYKFNVMQYMEDAEVLVDESGVPLVSWKANKRGSRSFLLKGI